MTCPSESASRRGRAGTGARAALVLALSIALNGCGDEARERLDPRAAAAALMERLADGDARGVCRSLSGRAQAELARDFGGSNCSATATAAVRYVRDRAGMRDAVRGVRILPTSDVPLSPAPQRAGTGRAALRLVIDDPVIGRRQAFDIVLRRIGGRWRVDRGVAALFTIGAVAAATPPDPLPHRAATDRGPCEAAITPPSTRAITRTPAASQVGDIRATASARALTSIARSSLVECPELDVG